MLTLVIVTRNGAPTLPALFEALSRIEVPAGGWKLVLADNGSTDDTRVVVERYQASLPIKYVFEPKPGVNVARNVALRYLEGNLVVFTDDDTTPDTDWLTSLHGVAEAQREYSMFGGTILPRWEREPPPWILHGVDLGICFALTDPAQPEGPCSPASVWGPNMAVRRDVFEAGHLFDESMGPRGKSYPMGSETEFVTRLAHKGHRAWFCKSARVRHFIRGYQLDRNWILARALRFGRGRYVLQSRDAPYRGPFLFGMPRYLIRLTAEQYLRLLKARLFNSGRAFDEHFEFKYRVGQLVEARQRSTSRQAIDTG